MAGRMEAQSRIQVVGPNFYFKGDRMEIVVYINQRIPELFMKMYSNAVYIMVSAVRRDASWLGFASRLTRRWSAFLDADLSCDYTFNFTAIQ